ncbi:hypothetical protein C8Q77DRAFT_170644 [Trametes polyzona]|nr:hypothetical protein C8Q77DRAFT_170644 [Trametes polyzona]
MPAMGAFLNPCPPRHEKLRDTVNTAMTHTGPPSSSKIAIAVRGQLRCSARHRHPMRVACTSTTASEELEARRHRHHILLAVQRYRTMTCGPHCGRRHLRRRLQWPSSGGARCGGPGNRPRATATTELDIHGRTMPAEDFLTGHGRTKEATWFDRGRTRYRTHHKGRQSLQAGTAPRQRHAPRKRSHGTTPGGDGSPSWEANAGRRCNDIKQSSPPMGC